MSPAKARKNPEPPEHLSEASQAWWREVIDGYDLAGHDLKLLELACGAYDRATEARAVIEREGITFETKSGDVKTHPAVLIENQARTSFARLVREMGLDLAETSPDSRPPRRY